jgi:hypothetical protein
MAHVQTDSHGFLSLKSLTGHFYKKSTMNQCPFWVSIPFIKWVFIIIFLLSWSGIGQIGHVFHKAKSPTPSAQAMHQIVYSGCQQRGRQGAADSEVVLRWWIFLREPSSVVKQVG